MWSLFPRFITWRPRAFNSHGAWHSAHRQLNWTFHPVANLSSPWDEIRIRQPGQVWISNGWLHRISNNHGNQCACVWARVDPQTVHVHYLGTQLFNKRQKKIYLTIKKKSRIDETSLGIQDASCVGPGKSNLPFELRRKAGDYSRVTAGPIDLI